jgi:glycosyltransferase involved in cell wall biosynthesis
MNIVMIGPFGLRPKGTMAVRALPLARELVQRGHRVAIVAPPWNYPADSGSTYTDGGVQVINIKLPPRLPAVWHLAITWRLLRAALAQNPDVVHCFKPKAYSGLAALALQLARGLRLTRVRIVVDSDDWEGRGGWNEIERYSRVQRAFFAWQEGWGLSHADAVTVASRALQTIVWSLGVAPARVAYVPNGVASGKWSAAAGNNDSAARQAARVYPTLLLYTRFFEFSVERAVRIIAGTLSAVADAHVIVVGAGLFGEEKAFVAQIAAAGLADRVTYAGWRAPDELPAIFAGADVAIYPFDDTLINRCKCAVKLIDLLAAGVAVVADGVGQNNEYIEHQVSGILVEPGDDAAFINWVRRLLHDKDLRRSLGDKARRRMADHFTWAQLAARVEDCYR